MHTIQNMRLLILLLFLVVWVPCTLVDLPTGHAQGQTASVRAIDPLSSLRFRDLTTDHGMPHNRVEAMVQDRRGFMWFAQFIGLCSSLKWSRHLTKSPFLALPATAGSNAAYKIISACSNAVS